MPPPPSTTIELPTPLRDRLQRLKAHPRQAYHEVIAAALDRLEQAGGAAAPGTVRAGGLDPLVSRHRKAILAIARRHGVTRISVFGSRARGDFRPDSDLDLLIAMERGRSLLDQVEFEQEVGDRLELRVESVEREALHPLVARNALREAVPL